MERIEELQRTTQQLAAKLAAREPTPASPPPVVIVNRVAAPPTAPCAFWERSYLGRATLRVRR